MRRQKPLARDPRPIGLACLVQLADCLASVRPESKLDTSEPDDVVGRRVPEFGRDHGRREGAAGDLGDQRPVERDAAAVELCAVVQADEADAWRNGHARMPPSRGQDNQRLEVKEGRDLSQHLDDSVTLVKPTGQEEDAIAIADRCHAQPPQGVRDRLSRGCRPADCQGRGRRPKHPAQIQPVDVRIMCRLHDPHPTAGQLDAAFLVAVLERVIVTVPRGQRSEQGRLGGPDQGTGTNQLQRSRAADALQRGPGDLGMRLLGDVEQDPQGHATSA